MVPGKVCGRNECAKENFQNKLIKKSLKFHVMKIEISFQNISVDKWGHCDQNKQLKPM